MPGKHRRASDKSRLALCLAEGDSVAASARANQLPKSTAYRWARSPDVREAVDTCRRGLIDRAVGVLAGCTARAGDRIATIAMSAESESVRLGAFRAILRYGIGGSRLAKLERRLAQIEERVGTSAETAILSAEAPKAGKPT